MSISLTDRNDWSTDFSGLGSLLDGKKLSLPNLELKHFWSTPLNKLEPISFGPGTVNFSGGAPLPLGASLNVGGTAGAEIGEQIGGSVCGGADPDDQPIALGNNCALWVKFNGTTEIGASGTVSGFGIGLKARSNAHFTYMQIFQPDAGGHFLSLSQGLQQLLGHVTVPADLGAIMAAPIGSIFEFDAGGSVQLTGSYSLPASTFPLATATVPVLKDKLSLHGDTSVGVSGSFELNGQFLFRVYKSSSNLARFQLFKKTGTEVEVSFNASAGLSGGVAGKDLVDSAFQAILPRGGKLDLASQNPHLNEQIAGVMQDAIRSHLSATLNASASFAHSNSHLFSADVDLDVANTSQEMRDAVNGLFRGDWTLAQKHDLKCVLSYSDMLETVTKSGNAFHFHLLNLFSYVSVTDFLNSAKVLRTPDGVVFTDHDTASHIEAGTNVADPKRFSKVLARAVESTLCFKTGKAVPALVELNISGNYFLYEPNASRDDLNEISLLSAALDCPMQGLQPDTTRVGVVKFEASSKFDSSASDACFLGPAPSPPPDPSRDFGPKQKSEYIAIARRAIESLYEPGDRFHAAVSNDQLWARLDATGSPSAMLADDYVQWFLRSHGGYDGHVGNIGQVMWLFSVWYTVTFWSDAMADYAALLQKTKKLAQQLAPGQSQDTPQTRKLMRQLASAMQKAQSEETNYIDERAQFGLVAMYLASGRKAANEVSLTWNGISKSAKNKGLLAGAAG